jgi:uncharacterized protein (TIGR03663 family)
MRTDERRRTKDEERRAKTGGLTPPVRPSSPAPSLAEGFVFRPWEQRGLTVGGALAVGLLILAAITRFYALGGRPLGADEAANALAAWHFVQGQPEDLTPFSPLVTNANLLLFFLFGGSDFAARAVPALFGTLLVVLPMVVLRSRVGTAAALAAGLLILFSPTFLLFSRSVDPAVITAACALVLVAALFAYLEGRDARHLAVAAAALGLGLTAGPGIYTLLLLGLVFVAGTWLLHRLGDERAPWPLLVAAARDAARDRWGLARAGVVLAVVFGAAATGFLANFGGVQAALNLFVRWAESFGQPQGFPIWYHLGVLVLYEPVSLVAGLVGMAVVLRRRDPFGRFLVFWFLGSLALYTVLGAAQPALSVSMLLPLMLLGGIGVARILEFGDWVAASGAGIVAALITPMLVYAGLQVSIYAISTTQPVRLWMALGAAALAVVAAVIFVLSGIGAPWGRTTVLQGLGVSLLLFTLGLTVHMSTWLNYRHVNPTRELLLQSPTSPDLRRMVEVLQVISQERTGDTVSLPIAVDGRLGAVVPWHLRDFTHVTVVSTVRGPTGTPAVIVPAVEEQPPIGDEYVGQRFRLATDWRPVGLTGVDLLRWYLWREGPTIPTRDVILYVSR